MAALRPWPAYVIGGGTPYAERHTLKTGETFSRGDFVTLDSNEDVLEVTSADQTPVLGIAAENAADVVESGFVMVYPFTGTQVFAITGDNDPTADDVNQDYGYVEDGDGVYTLDGTDTTNTFFHVHGVDTTNNYYFVTVLQDDRYYK
jgi:hypothetical protein